MCLITCSLSGKVETPCEGMSQFCHRLQNQEDALPTEDATNSAALSQISPFLPVAWVGWPKYKHGIIRTFTGYFPFCRKNWTVMYIDFIAWVLRLYFGHLTSLMPSHLLLLFLYTSHFLIIYKPCAICTILFLVAVSFALEGVRLASCGAFTEQWFFSKNLLKDCFIALVTLGEKRTNEKVKFTFEEGVDNSWKKDAISDSGCEWQVLRHWWPIVLVLFDRLNCFDLCFVYNA